LILLGRTPFFNARPPHENRGDFVFLALLSAAKNREGTSEYWIVEEAEYG
jgi:hypothetical protein